MALVTRLADTTPHINMQYTLQSFVPLYFRGRLGHWPSIQLYIGKLLSITDQAGFISNCSNEDTSVKEQF